MIQDPMNTNYLAVFIPLFFVPFLISLPINRSVRPSNLSAELLEAVQLPVWKPLLFYLIGR